VIVSTDDADIAQVARRHGAEVVERPAELSGDTASSESAVLHVLNQLSAHEGYLPELVMLMQCTSPLTSAEDLSGLITTLEREQADAAFLAVPFAHFLWSLDRHAVSQPINHEGKKRKRRQELAPQYLENGAAYLMRTQAFVASGERFWGRVTLHAVDPARCLEIDDPIDLAKAEAALRQLTAEHHADCLPRPVACLVMDFDGVLTDDHVYVDQQGVESVRCSRADGLGLALLRERGVKLLILSKEQNPVVSARAQKLRVECLQGVDDKLSGLRAWAESNAVALEHTVYVGNDVNDLECMRHVGCAAAPADAQLEARRAARILLSRSGGDGAVRELCDLILAAQGNHS
jgi:N-acylneuraminate cytidylyltransferase